VSGHAFSFSPDGGGIAGATVSILELPERSATTAEDGAFALDGLPSGAEVSLVMTHPDHPPIQTGTFVIDEADIEQVTFQSPTWDMYQAMASFAGVDPSPELCQVATTVTRLGGSLYGTLPEPHGEAGATVAIDPPVSAESGPVYFNLITYNIIYPDPDLTETTDDGGVLFVNVPAGEYTLTAHKAGKAFTTARVKCSAGMLVNASPPWGLTVLGE
jgi:hypothetical protein